jgi:hypothetical protein
LLGINPVLIIVLVIVVVAAFTVFVIPKVVGANRRQVSTGREETPITVVPKTPLGRWSVGLTIAFILSLVLVEVLTGFNLPNPESNLIPAIILTIIIAGISGSAFVTGLISMIKSKERSILVFVGMVVSFWMGLLGAVGYLLI